MKNSFLMTGPILKGLISLAALSFFSCAPRVAAKPAVVAESPEFKRIAGLQGHWTGNSSGPEGAQAVDVDYRVTSGGSAVVEELFSHTANEMISVYHQNAEALQLTHYCMLHNQPEMKAEPMNANILKFDFIGGSNMKSEREMHMHELEITFVDSNHIREAWTAFEEGKVAGTTVFNLRRVN